jgi:hypothetical protein
MQKKFRISIKAFKIQLNIFILNKFYHKNYLKDYIRKNSVLSNGKILFAIKTAQSFLELLSKQL